MYLISKVFHELCFVVKKMVPLACCCFLYKNSKIIFPQCQPPCQPQPAPPYTISSHITMSFQCTNSACKWYCQYERWLRRVHRHVISQERVHPAAAGFWHHWTRQIDQSNSRWSCVVNGDHRAFNSQRSRVTEWALWRWLHHLQVHVKGQLGDTHSHSPCGSFCPGGFWPNCHPITLSCTQHKQQMYDHGVAG